MIKYDNYIYVILDKIAKYKGWGLMFEPGLNKSLNSQFLDKLEKGEYIIINGKSINDKQIIEYNNIELTSRGVDLYKRFQYSNSHIEHKIKME